MIYLDIETLQQDPYPWMVRSEAELRPPKNYKDPEKIAAWRAEALASQDAELREQSSLEPMLGGLIVCVGVAIGDGEPVVLTAETDDEAGERALLARVEAGLCQVVREVDRSRLPIVCWHGAFDWAYIAKRAIRHGLHRLARRALAAKPWGDRLHVDAREPWTRLDSRALSRLQDVARYLGIRVDDAVSGAQTTALWTGGHREAVIDHCRSDVRILREVVAHQIAAGWTVVEGVEEREVFVPPPRGSQADLLARVTELQIASDPSQVAEALVAAGIASQAPDPRTELRSVLESLPSQPTDRLRAYLVALGGRP